MKRAAKNSCLLATASALVISAVPAFAAALVTGQTIADARLQQDVIAHPGFVVMLNSQSGCSKADSIKSTIVQAPKDTTAGPNGKLLNGQWEELWTVSACGKEVPVYVYFKSDGHGGTDFGIGSK
jgi:hypothetical protein